MNGLENMGLAQRVNVYKQFDEARHSDLEQFAEEYELMRARISELEADLDDERTSRRSWRMRAEAAEQSVGRNNFAVVLIDGDGYHFSRSFYMNGAGAQAAHTLYTEAQQYLKDNHESTGDMELLVMVFFNKQVPAKALVDADLIHRPAELDEFFWSFTSSHSLFQTIDCGPGKERADSKLRDTYRFYLSNAQCKHLFLACCHDNGYVAELDKYRHDSIAASKTILVKHGNTANQFYNLNLPIARFSTTFEMEPLQAVRRVESTPSYIPKAPRVPSSDSASQTSGEGGNTPGTTWSTVTAGAARLPTRPTTTTSTPTPMYADASEPTKVSATATGDAKSGIPVNRHGQRIDRRLQAPSSTELDRFEDRISSKKLCNTQHLTNAGCFAYNCRYDHDPIDATMKHTLKYKARSIPCSTGSKCRKSDCFYGHQCPWGNANCTNTKCAFWRNGLHEVNDMEIAKFVPAIA